MSGHQGVSRTTERVTKSFLVARHDKWHQPLLPILRYLSKKTLQWSPTLVFPQEEKGSSLQGVVTSCIHVEVVLFLFPTSENWKGPFEKHHNSSVKLANIPVNMFFYIKSLFIRKTETSPHSSVIEVCSDLRLCLSVLWTHQLLSVDWWDEFSERANFWTTVWWSGAWFTKDLTIMLR